MIANVYRCGWGSASLYLAEIFPNSKITAFSNSRTQKLHIDGVAAEKGFKNLKVITGDVADYEFEHDAFDRVISVEMIGKSDFTPDAFTRHAVPEEGFCLFF